MTTRSNWVLGKEWFFLCRCWDLRTSREGFSMSFHLSCLERFVVLFFSYQGQNGVERIVNAMDRTRRSLNM